MVRVETVKTERGEMKCTVFGAGKRQMVIVPGLSVRNISEIAEQVAAAYASFSEEYTVYLFDRPSYIPCGYTMSEMSEAVAAGMKKLDVKNAYLFGASQGGMIALYLAERHSELVRCMAISSSSALIRDDFRAVCENWKRLAAAKDSLGLTEYFNKVLFSKATLEKIGAALLANVPEYNDAELERFINLVNAFDTLDVKDRIADIKCPVLVTAAMGDRVFGYYASAEIAEELACDIVTYGPEYGHAVYDEVPDFIETIMSFFNKN